MQKVSETRLTAKEREPGIELMRILMMFGICVLHTAHLGLPFKVLSANSIFWALFVCSVDGFVFISGYYGIKFRLSKIVSLYTIGTFCALLNLIGLIVTGHPVRPATYEVFERFFCGTWFLHAYAVLMCFAPLVNRCLNAENKRGALEVAIPMIALVFGWTWFSGECKILKVPFPCSTGFESHSWLTLLGVYVVARLYRVLKFERFIKWWMVIVFVPAITVATAFYRGILGSYNSPQIIFFTLLVFWSFKQMKVSSFWSKAIAFVAPSLFAVYLLHYGPYGRLIYEHFVYLKLSTCCPVVILSALLAVAVFVLSLLADAPRRFLTHVFHRRLSLLNDKMDRAYQKLLEKGGEMC